jgi:hypothetical protein
MKTARKATLTRMLLVLAVAFSWLPGSQVSALEPPAEARWWKGNLHTHSLWSDGDDYPEMIADWYKRNGYDFLAFSDHNILLEGERWIPATNNRGGAAALEKYRKRFGPHWVQERKDGPDGHQVRLKPLPEFRHLFEEPNGFLLIPSEEITDNFRTAPVHINATNLRDYIPPQGGDSVLEVMQRNVDAVLEQRERTGQPMFPHLNHPNFGWGVTAEELMKVEGERFFEVYNGHPAVRNEGDTHHASTERMWDIILTFRLAELGMEPMFGIAVDDSHNYHVEGPDKSNTGRGWVMVRCHFLTPEQIVLAMEAGDFYSSTGVTLKGIRRGPDVLAVEIEPEEGVTYSTQFIGTRKEFDAANEPIRTTGGEALRVTHRYSEDVGAVFAEISGTNPSYTLAGDELYVRAKVTSSKVKENPYKAGELEVAWTQPLIPQTSGTHKE